MKLVTLLLIFLCSSVFANDCNELANDCEFYTCIAESKHCSDRSYPISFGYRYCLRYEERINTFSDAGKTWIQDVRQCLIREMALMEESLTCQQLKRKAFKTHVPCYLESGICQLSLEDKKSIIKTIWPSIRNINILASALKVLKDCSF